MQSDKDGMRFLVSKYANKQLQRIFEDFFDKMTSKFDKMEVDTNSARTRQRTRVLKGREPRDASFSTQGRNRALTERH